MPFEQSRGWARAELDGEGWLQGALRYLPALDILPFGQLNRAESAKLAPLLPSWVDHLAQLNASGNYRWILLDIPAGHSEQSERLLTLADAVICPIIADANCQIRLHQQVLPAGSRLLLNQFTSTSLLQNDLYQYLLQTQPRLLPMIIHRDEALSEALASKQPVGEYRPESMAASEILTLAHWCLIHLGGGTR